MKITLAILDMAPEAEECLIEWIHGRIEDKSTNNDSPLRYVDTMKVER